MIHTLPVTVDSTPETLKKEFRKRLMTGGCVIRIPSEFTAADCDQIFNQFILHYVPSSAAAEVLRQLAYHTNATSSLREKLSALNDRAISEALAERYRSADGA